MTARDRRRDARVRRRREAERPSGRRRRRGSPRRPRAGIGRALRSALTTDRRSRTSVRPARAQPHRQPRAAARGRPASGARRRRAPPASMRAGPVCPCSDDVARAAGVHGGDWDAERARFDEHAAERLRTARREDEHGGVAQPRGRLRLIDPAARNGCPASSAPLPRQRPSRSGRRRRSRAASRVPRARRPGSRWLVPLFGASLPR